MRRLWLAGALLVGLVGCRDRYNRTAVGTERPVTDVGRAAPGGTRQGAECVAQDQADETRLLAIFDVVAKGEVEAAQLAQDQASSQQVKQFAAMMNDAHSKNRRDIAELADREKLAVDTAENTDVYAQAFEAAHRAHMAVLRGLHGSELDIAYMRGQPEKHELLAQLAFFAQNGTTDSNVRGLLASMTKELQQHYEMAVHAMPAACSVPMAPGGAPGALAPTPGTQVQLPGTNPPGSGVGLTPKGAGPQIPAPPGTGREGAEGQPPQGEQPQQGAQQQGAQQQGAQAPQGQQGAQQQGGAQGQQGAQQQGTQGQGKPAAPSSGGRRGGPSSGANH